MDSLDLVYKGNRQARIVGIFLAIEIILYVTFLYLDITNQYLSISKASKFTGILICFLFVLLPYRGKAKDDLEDKKILSYALLFTLFSDYILMFTNNIIVGLISFIIVQFIYLKRIYRWKFDCGKPSLNRYYFRNIIIWLFVLLMFLTVITIINKNQLISQVFPFNLGLSDNLVIVLATLYFISLIFNFIR